MNFITYDKDRNITRTGKCQPATFAHQAGKDGFVMEGEANDVRQKIEFDGFDEKGQPVNPRVIDKTHEEIAHDNPKSKPKPFKKRRANITNEQWQDVLDRIDKLAIR